ncbi:hypothetical protein TPADAL_0705b [Treponema pallidum subsp. pallidum DAL-1]|uniref:Uncharacterized protein n=2 Tax=Treponema pallidum TaxID=160 RepID=A0AAU8RNB9_TREPL|nr:hypothetical protein TPESAMD_0705b [Treponema pallidum subsp. pertenue str. SamoaD]AEZ58900.1 hypothetical protein TPECDC2_0705b [Treponema pallidum subsp. pertenue str. CDC2]AEZ59968.1 hypothetical protein TPEGAU_0705b [Treponema pallidum subsp. pertenue str. Gauthier]AEZ61028.1 hypothetical protein TPADAL_0705b [Treponema pallidum subsp. pallidum DAL-1]AGK84352.1 hypothetical protein TPFB_0705b [Treponema pallidum str. Fribourg-Blanc]AJB40728.1 hypothetical protein TENDBA_0705b [Treponema
MRCRRAPPLCGTTVGRGVRTRLKVLQVEPILGAPAAWFPSHLSRGRYVVGPV